MYSYYYCVFDPHSETELMIENSLYTKYHTTLYRYHGMILETYIICVFLVIPLLFFCPQTTFLFDVLLLWFSSVPPFLKSILDLVDASERDYYFRFSICNSVKYNRRVRLPNLTYYFHRIFFIRRFIAIYRRFKVWLFFFFQTNRIKLFWLHRKARKFYTRFVMNCILYNSEKQMNSRAYVIILFYKRVKCTFWWKS